MKDWLRLYLTPVVVGLLITAPAIGILTFGYMATDEPTQQEVLTAKYVIWPAGVTFRKHLTDSYTVDDHGFLVFVDKERGVQVKIPMTQIQLIEPAQ